MSDDAPLYLTPFTILRLAARALGGLLAAGLLVLAPLAYIKGHLVTDEPGWVIVPVMVLLALGSIPFFLEAPFNAVRLALALQGKRDVRSSTLGRCLEGAE